jgi:hypothetical protein
VVVFNTSDTVDTHDFARVRVAGLERVLGSSPPRFMVTVPHGYADPDRVEADLIAGGLVCESAETVTLVGTAESAADIAVGFCTGTPGFRAEIEARADLADATALVASEVTARLGTGPVSGENDRARLPGLRA